MKKFEIETDNYIDVFDVTNTKLFTLILDSKDYLIGFLSKVSPFEYDIKIMEKDYFEIVYINKILKDNNHNQ